MLMSTFLYLDIVDFSCFTGLGGNFVFILFLTNLLQKLQKGFSSFFSWIDYQCEYIKLECCSEFLIQYNYFNHLF